jgi:glycosyltransferase involved in cell wall biosynthesis
VTEAALDSNREAAREVLPVRVLNLHSGNLYGGVEAFLATTAVTREVGHLAHVGFALCFEGRLSRTLREAGAAVHMLGEVRLRSPRQIAAARGALARVLDQERYDVVVCHSAWTYVLFAAIARERGAKLVFYLHDVPNRAGWLDRWANLTAPDLLLCNSVFTRSSAAWLFPKAPRRVVLLPVPEPRVTASRSSVRSALGAGDAVVILQASRLQAWKGHETLLEALALLRTEAPWTCWIVGGVQRPSEVAFERSLRATRDRLGLAERVKFLGQRDDVAALMRAADIYCQANVRPEPFGVSFVEALGAGLPVVTTDIGGAREIVTPACGSLVPPGPTTLAAALAEYVDSAGRRSAASRAGPARARELCEVAGRTRDLAYELAAVVNPTRPLDRETRASLSEGRSDDAIAGLVREVLREKAGAVDVLVDLGCGQGNCARALDGLFRAYVGCDLVRYSDFPRGERLGFRTVDLNVPPYPLESESADAVVAVETIEHVENARALVREMTRVVRHGGWVVVTTPNQLSLASKLSLVLRNEFLAFREAPGLYPAHVTALVEIDLRRIANECGLGDVDIRYTNRGRIPLTAKHWPSRIGARGRWFSDNVVMIARRP